MKKSLFIRSILLYVVLTACLTALPGQVAPAAETKTPANVQKILQYISSGWDALSRSMTECRTYTDPKTNVKSVLYLPADFPEPAGLRAAAAGCQVQVSRLPVIIKKLGAIDLSAAKSQGLLYLPKPYVVPGGMFNEMYGWDSYFIIRGLVEDGRLNLAQDIIDNFFFEIDHYGGVLNANRTYYLTRSQPPFLTSMIRAVYEAEKAKGQLDPAWLRTAYDHAVKDYRFWTEPPHLAGDTGLSRFYDFGEGPVPELGPATDTYYRTVAQYFLLHPQGSQPYLQLVPKNAKGSHATVMGPEFSLNLDFTLNEPGAKQQDETLDKFVLTPRFYKGDRSMRESGFDVSFRFGPFGAGTPDFAAVGLNCLLYKSEQDLEWMSAQLDLKKASTEWRQRAATRHQEIDRYLWSSSYGLYYDYDFTSGTRSRYSYATTFYPLWVGLASPEQAKAIFKNLAAFDRPGGIVMSMINTGAQWDAPYGWAPIELIAIEGLRRYGYIAEANGISLQFLSMVLDNFLKDGTIREKYDVDTRSSETDIQVGYKTNVVGFGWTNGAFVALYNALPKAAQQRLAQE
ncbi:MAG TPA: trehalase family glycosidase [Terriglobia bacterium]|nr:trehalase family glycosidase [Terriglobia bacterium]